MNSPTKIDDALEFIRRAYADCESYRDHGEVEVTHIQGPQPWQRVSTVGVFRTRFRRPDSFFFEFRQKTLGPESEWSRYVVWGKEGAFESWWTLQPDRIDQHDSIHRAIAGPTGISHGTAYRVPTLLVPGGEGTSPLPSVDNARLGARAEIDGIECYAIEAAPPYDRCLWSSCSDFLIRKTYEEQTFDAAWREETRGMLEKHLSQEMVQELSPHFESAADHRSQATTRYSPELNATIPDRELEFAPPT